MCACVCMLTSVCLCAGVAHLYGGVHVGCKYHYPGSWPNKQLLPDSVYCWEPNLGPLH